MPALDFSIRHAYSPLSVGIEVPIILSSGAEHQARLRAKVDTGASFCVFQRDYAEQLGLDPEAGERLSISTAVGSFEAYGHLVTLACMEWQWEAMVYFAASPAFRRNVLGRSGWLQQLRVAIVDYDSVIYLAKYED